MSDPAKYRTKEELEEFKLKDPIEHVLNIINEDDYEAADQLIIRALQSYVQLPLKERIKLHMKELDKLRKQLRQESRIRLS